jgi:hypothetical protein
MAFAVSRSFSGNDVIVAYERGYSEILRISPNLITHSAPT